MDYAHFLDQLIELAREFKMTPETTLDEIAGYLVMKMKSDPDLKFDLFLNMID